MFFEKRKVYIVDLEELYHLMQLLHFFILVFPLKKSDEKGGGVCPQLFGGHCT